MTATTERDAAATDATATPAPAVRGRRSARAAGDEREQAILRTAETLLERRPPAANSVDGLARGAGLSLSAFYFYFPSKAAVVLMLVDRMVEQASGARDTALAQLDSDPAAACRAGIEGFYATFGAHRPVVRDVSALSAPHAQARQLS